MRLVRFFLPIKILFLAHNLLTQLPQQLAQASGTLTFSETFLFADANRYQLRSLAGSQTP